MTTRPIALALIVSLAPLTLGVAPSVAVAQDNDPTMRDARARFKEGVEAYEKQQYEKARAAFKQSYALNEHPLTLFNLAWACVKSGHALEGERLFVKLLKDAPNIPPDKLPPEKRTEAEKGLAEARSKLGRIEISAASGAEIYVDDSRVGTAPLTEPVTVEPGAHTVKAKASDGTIDSQSVSVLGGQTVSARFAAKTAPTPPVPTNANGSPNPTENPGGEPPPNNPNPDNTQPPPNAEQGKKSNLLAPPKNLTPVFIGLGVTVLGFGTSIAMLVVKNSAQNNATSVANAIHTAGGGPGTCNNPSSRFAQACSALASDNNDVNTDATVGNIALAVGAVGLVGTVIYYLAAAKNDDSSTSTSPASSAPPAAMRPQLTPIVGTKVGGLSVSGQF